MTTDIGVQCPDEQSLRSTRWRPSISMGRLRERAVLNARIRGRFARQGVTEVDTPVLSLTSCLDPQVPSMRLGGQHTERWLQTSPENHMKRLLAAGSGPIYRLGPVFREGERGRWHAPEFTMLEWYRPGFDDRVLMRDVAGLVQELGGPDQVVYRRYYDLIAEHTGVDPMGNIFPLVRWCEQRGLVDSAGCSRDELLDFAMGAVIGPELAPDHLLFVTHFPASQAALARLDPDDPQVARRFELYWRGVELANGFYELCNASEQRSRFDAEQQHRVARGLPSIPQDQALLAALEHGMPEVAGVALGIDRLYALLMGTDGIGDVQCFSWDIA